MKYYIVMKFPEGLNGERQHVWVTPDIEAAEKFVKYMRSQQEGFDYEILAVPELPSLNNKSK
jgi:hypothetical protein